MTRFAIAVLLLAATHNVDAQSSAENAFDTARDWTVYIRTSIDRAFIEDEQGSLFGSGFVVDSARGWVLTNAHVASNSYSEITVGFRGQKSIHAERLYVDLYLDVAIIAYDPVELKIHPPQAELECEANPARTPLPPSSH